VRSEAAESLAAATGCDVARHHRELVDTCDAVLLCTPPSTHAPLAIELLEAGLPVLCEKPLATSVPDALAMLEAARRTGLPFSMASKFRFVDDVVAARTMVQDGVLGEVLLIENIFASRVDMRGRWNADPAIAGGGVLIDNGTHSVDLVRSILGSISEVAAVEARRVQQLEVEDTARLFLRTADGASATCDLSWSIDKQRHDFLEIAGTEGTVQVGWKVSRYQLADRRGWVKLGHGYDKVAALRGVVENFACAVRGECLPLVTPEDALASVLVIEGAYASLRQDHWVGVPEGAVQAWA
jgi:predicted dehydrogenase